VSWREFHAKTELHDSGRTGSQEDETNVFSVTHFRPQLGSLHENSW